MRADGGVARDGAAEGEQAFYDGIADRFWDPSGPMHALHVINPMRTRWISDRARECRLAGAGAIRPLAGLHALDLGCGAGLLAEALARGGARVTGLDASPANIDAARRHAAGRRLDIDYVAGTPATLPAGRQFDLVCALEVVEHVADLAGFLAAGAARVRAGGLLVVSTIARTPESLALAKLGAEYVLRLLPPGTHRWADFRNPDEVAAALAPHGLRQVAITGMAFLPLVDRAWWVRSTRMNWMAAYRKAYGPERETTACAS